MKDIARRSPVRIVAAAVVTLAAACALAQYAIPQPGGVGQINTQVNTELYGGGVSASVRYASVGSTSRPLDSELRHAYWKSGALPSDIRMGYAALGPMNPSGPMAYIPPGPNYMPNPSKAPPPPMSVSALSGGSVHYSAPASVTNSYVPPKGAPSAAPVSPALVSRGPINAAPINSGTVRYGR